MTALVRPALALLPACPPASLLRLGHLVRGRVRVRLRLRVRVRVRVRV